MVRVPAPIAHWMADHSPAERWIAVALAIAVATALLWLAAWQPMTRDVASMRTAHAMNTVALAEARTMVKEITGRPPGSAISATADPRTDLDRVLTQRNLRPLVTSVDWRDGRARVLLPAVSYDALIAGLEALQRDARLRTVEATLTARVEPGTVRAEITLAR